MAQTSLTIIRLAPTDHAYQMDLVAFSRRKIRSKADRGHLGCIFPGREWHEAKINRSALSRLPPPFCWCCSRVTIRFFTFGQPVRLMRFLKIPKQVPVPPPGVPPVDPPPPSKDLIEICLFVYLFIHHLTAYGLNDKT